MALRLEDKQAIVADVAEVASSALSAVVADYQGLTVAEMTELRNRARSQGVYIRVVRNTLLKRALKGSEYECLEEVLIGPTILAFSQEDPGSAARVAKDFAKDFAKFEVKALAVGGRLLSASNIDALAKLPTRDEALAQLMSVMQAPIAKLARTMNEVPSKLVRVIAAVKDQKEAA